MREISLVDIPQHQSSTFVIGKSAGGEDNIIQSVILSKAVFRSASTAREHLKACEFAHSDIREDTDCFIAVQEGMEHFDSKSLKKIKSAPGVDLIVGPYEQVAKTKTFVSVPNFSDKLKTATKCEEPVMAGKSKVTLEGDNISVQVGNQESPEAAEVVTEEKSVVKPTVPMSDIKSPTGSAASADQFQLNDDMMGMIAHVVSIKSADIAEKAAEAAIEAYVKKCACEAAALEAKATETEEAPVEGAEVKEGEVVEEKKEEAEVETPAVPETPAEPLAEGSEGFDMAKRLNEIEANLNNTLRVVAEHIDAKDQEVEDAFKSLRSEIQGSVIEPTKRTEGTPVSKSSNTGNKSLNNIFKPLFR